jgi:hypothetical protein
MKVMITEKQELRALARERKQIEKQLSRNSARTATLLARQHVLLAAKAAAKPQKTGGKK